MKIHLIQGTTGQYEDRYCWHVCAFIDKRKADTLCDELNRLSYKIYQLREQLDFNSKRISKDKKHIDLTKEITALDKKFDIIDSTSYTVYEIELKE